MQPLPIANRVRFALLTTAIVFVTTCLASWVAMRDAPVMMSYGSSLRVLFSLKLAHEELVRHADEHGEYPDTLSELDIPAEQLASTIRDPWGNQLDYSKSDHGFKLASLGRDGKPGGHGLDADVYTDQTMPSDQTMAPQTRLPLSQFFFQTPGSEVVLGVAMLAGICAGAVSYLSTAPRKGQAESGTRILRDFVVQVVSATIVAVLLAVFYVAMSQSGH